MKEENLRKKLMLMKQPELIKKTDTMFQLMRRMECSDKNGMAECVSCGRIHHYKLMDGGHFIQKGSTGNFGSRYKPNNVWPQCKYCNKELSGNYTEYRVRLVSKIGKDLVEFMELNRNNTDGVWLRELLIETYISSKNKIKKLKETTHE